MSKIEQKHISAAREMVEVFADKLGKRRAVHPETAVAAGARMAGTFLFRSFGFDTTEMSPGSAILSEEANEKGPELVNIAAFMLHQYGLHPDQDKLTNASDRGEAPKLTVIETQELLEADLTKVREKYGLSLEDGARSCAAAVAFLVRECAPRIGLEVGFNIATYGFIEGCKTVPISPQPAGRHPWYQFWK